MSISKLKSSNGIRLKPIISPIQKEDSNPLFQSSCPLPKILSQTKNDLDRNDIPKTCNFNTNDSIKEYKTYDTDIKYHSPQHTISKQNIMDQPAITILDPVINNEKIDHDCNKNDTINLNPIASDIHQVKGDSVSMKSELKCEDRLSYAMQGLCPISDLPQLNKKAVRLFISSTFTDTKEERNILMKNIYPKLSLFCQQNYGLEFQVVDMRWGVPIQACDSHSTTHLCLKEIHRCRQLSIGPYFVAIIGDKYGYRPLPSQLPKKEFEDLKSIILKSCEGESNWTLVEKWYLLDENVLPPVYLLQPISKICAKDNNFTWSHTEAEISAIFRSAAIELKKQNLISDSDSLKYFMSVTENEIREGMLSSDSSSNICIIRRMQGLDCSIDEEIVSKFMDIKNGAVESQAQELLSSLKDEALVCLATKHSLITAHPEWKHYINKDKQHEEYLTSICDEFYKKACKLISESSVRQESVYDDNLVEVLQHLHMVKERCQVFEGRQSIFLQIKSYLNGTSRFPLIVHGRSGCGKTSIMCRVYTLIHTWSQQNPKKKKVPTATLR